MTPRLLTYELQIDAPVELVFELLTDAAALLQWIAVEAESDPHPGGELTWTHANGQVVAGQYIEVRRPERLVFTYGWESNELVGPGATRVEIDLERLDPDATLLRLVHRGLPESEIDAHLGGWQHFLAELARLASQKTGKAVVS